LEGNDPSLLSRGQDIVTIRETLFPETIMDIDESAEDEQIFDANEDKPPVEEEKREKSVDELLRELRLGSKKQTFSFDDEGTSFGSKETADSKDSIQILTEELQEWRAKNVKSPYEGWTEQDKQNFTVSIEILPIFEDPLLSVFLRHGTN
jgi:hypothetical protein